MTKTIWVLNGPNLNRLGKREPHIYGSATLDDLALMLDAEAKLLGLSVKFFQTNHEGLMIDKIYEIADAGAGGVIINPGAWSHTSIALHDALAGIDLPVVEVHISNIHKREAFRHHSYISSVAKGVIVGMGLEGYLAALRSFAS